MPSRVLYTKQIVRYQPKSTGTPSSATVQKFVCAEIQSEVSSSTVEPSMKKKQIGVVQVQPMALGASTLKPCIVGAIKKQALSHQFNLTIC